MLLNAYNRALISVITDSFSKNIAFTLVVRFKPLFNVREMFVPQPMNRRGSRTVIANCSQNQCNSAEV